MFLVGGSQCERGGGKPGNLQGEGGGGVMKGTLGGWFQGGGGIWEPSE